MKVREKIKLSNKTFVYKNVLTDSSETLLIFCFR